MEITPTRLRRTLAWTCLCAWALSLVVPAAGWGANEPPVPGWQILVTGWLGVVNLQFGWFANILLIPCITLLLNDERPNLAVSTVIGIGIVALVGNACFWSSAHTPDGDYNVVRGAGFYLWAGGLVTAALGLLTNAFLQNNRREDF